MLYLYVMTQILGAERETKEEEDRRLDTDNDSCTVRTTTTTTSSLFFLWGRKGTSAGRVSLPLVAAEILLHQNEWILEVGRDAMSLSFSHVDAPHKIDPPNRKKSRVRAEHNTNRTTVRFSKCLGKEEKQEAASSAQTAPSALLTF